MNIKNSISRKLLTVLLVPLCVMFVLTGFVAYNLAAWFANDSYDKELLNAAHAVAARLTEDRKGIVADLPDAVQAVLRHKDRDDFFYQVLSLEKVRLAGDAILPMPIKEVNTDIPAFRNAVVNGQDVRIARIRMPLRQDSKRLVVVQVARTLNSRNELIHEIFLSIVVPQIILGLLSVAAVSYGVKDGLRPLIELSKEIQQRSQSDLTPIANENTPKEIVPIVESINSLFGRIDDHMEEQKRFVANAAHQLRTPVAGLRAYIEYGRRIANGNFSEVLNQIDSGTDRIAELVGGLLILARASERRVQPHDVVELNDLSSEVTSDLIRQAANKKIDLFFHPSSTRSIVLGDKNELREMLSNLVNNAVSYTPDGGIVSVTVKAGPPPMVTVQDTGPGIPVQERKRVFERFYRVLGTKVNGTGLGLAIVQEIANSHKAKVELLDPGEAKGTLVRITFPNFEAKVS